MGVRVSSAWRGTWPARRLTFPFLCSRGLDPSRPSTLPPLSCHKSQSPGEQSQADGIPISRAPLPGFHFSGPGPLSSEGLWLLWRADRKASWILLPWAPPELLEASLKKWAGPRCSFIGEEGPGFLVSGKPRLVSVGSESCEVSKPSSLPTPQWGRLRWREWNSNPVR